MPARFNSSYSLWPEQAQPRQRRSIALVSGGFVAGLVIAMAGNWMLLDTSRPTVGSAVAIATSGMSSDADLGAPQACDPKRAPYGIDRCPPGPAGPMVRAKQGEAAPVPPARRRSRAGARARLPIIGSTPAIEEKDGTDGRGDGAPPAMVADESTKFAPVRSGSDPVDMSASAGRPEMLSTRRDGVPAPNLETMQTTLTLEGGVTEAARQTEPADAVGTTAAREAEEGPSEKAKTTTSDSKKGLRKQSRAAAERVRRAERRTARRVPAYERIRKTLPLPFDYVAVQSYSYPQPRYSFAAQQSYWPRYGYPALRAPGMFPF